MSIAADPPAITHSGNADRGLTPGLHPTPDAYTPGDAMEHLARRREDVLRRALLANTGAMLRAALELAEARTDRDTLLTEARAILADFAHHPAASVRRAAALTLQGSDDAELIEDADMILAMIGAPDA